MLKSMRQSLFIFDSFVQSDESEDEEEVLATEQNADEATGVRKVARKDSKKVKVWRYLVIIMLLVAGASTSVLTYLLLNGEEEDDFETSYKLFTDTIKDATTTRIDSISKAFDGLSETVTGAALTSGSQFPYVSVPMFEVHGEHARQISGVEALTFAPLVTLEDQKSWENYAWDNQGWVEESRDVRLSGAEVLQRSEYIAANITSYVWQRETSEPYSRIPAIDTPFLPAWHTSPPPFDPAFVNYNLMSQFIIKYTYPLIQSMRTSIFSMIVDMSTLGSAAVRKADHDSFHAQFVEDTEGDINGYDHPHSLLMVPVFEKLNDRQSPIVGLIFGVVPWDRYLTNLLPEGTSGIFCVLRNTCGQTHTYSLAGSKAVYLGEGDFHETAWDKMKVEINLHGVEIPDVDGSCLYAMDVYPSNELHSEWNTRFPRVFASVVAGTFVIMALTFFKYDRFVQKRNKKVVSAAAKTEKVVAALFPSNVRDRLLADEEDTERRGVERGARTRLKDFLANDGPADADLESTDDFMFKTRPIADLFPEVTIMFADISGFSAWSSTREPSQVFLLLETVYKAFDDIAKKRRVFKVETVGDCYVAAAGLPEARKDHAIVMARFARECMAKMFSLTRRLEVSLGPDTADLSLRVGIHSGPVTAGVLRGERSRFQLFGDTMNTASRMESTGLARKIQISQEIAEILYAAGKGRWLMQREDKVVAKGKGELTTYWLLYHSGEKSDLTSDADRSSDDAHSDEVSSYSGESVMEAIEEDEEDTTLPQHADVSAKTSRLIDWNKDLLARLLKVVVARRQALDEGDPVTKVEEDFTRSNDGTVLEEVQEIVALPAYDPRVMKREVDPKTIDLGEDVEQELGNYVATIASMYRDNPFHNFDHASHVTLSVTKLLSRIVAPTDVDFDNNATRSQMLHDHTYGITSDPITQFACVLSALIHDVDHTGVPNTQLVKENKTMALYYKGRSVAEQNSVDVSFELLMDPAFAKLRGTIYQTEDEMRRFRQLVVNSVMATDIMDKELKRLRNQRWEMAFSEAALSESTVATVQRKATIVIEHLIQASDVAHTMQHWHIYRKWNKNLFQEMYLAYKSGRADKNPADFWYSGEIGFFDFYIIPLARKLKDCGVFGVSSDEYLNYALQNRSEWEEKGKAIVEELIESVKSIE